MGDIQKIYQMLNWKEPEEIQAKGIRLAKEIERVKAEINRAQGKLSNERFVSKAPEAVVAEERKKLAVAEDMLTKLLERQNALMDM